MPLRLQQRAGSHGPDGAEANGDQREKQTVVSSDTLLRPFQRLLANMPRLPMLGLCTVCGAIEKTGRLQQ